MKVLHIITGLTNGGAEGVLYRLVTNDKSNEHIVVSLMDEGKYGPLLVDKGINVHCLNMSQGKPSIKSVAKLFKLIKTIKPDVVQTWMYHADLIGGVVAKSLGVKKIFWNIRHSSFDSRHTKPSTIKIAKICAKLSNIIPSKIISCSNNAVDIHTNLGYSSRKIVTISNGYDLAYFKEDKNSISKLQKSLNLRGFPILGMVGRFNPQKNHKGLLQALSLIKEKGYKFDCLFVGTDLNSENTEILNLIKRYNLEEDIYLLGQRTDIPDIMHLLDIHILSSSYGEGFPNVLAEALACGTPCIATDVGDSKLIVDKYGLIVEPNNINSLAEAIMKLLDTYSKEPKIWESMKAESIGFVKQNFSLNKMISKYINVWTNS